MEDAQLELALSTGLTQHIQNSGEMRKRTFPKAFSDVVSRKRTLPCSGDPEEEKHARTSIITNRYVDVEEDAVVGWPPLKSSIRRFFEPSSRECTAANYGGGGGGGGLLNSMYVKVEMEGIGIARKTDLSIHHSYQSLTATLIAMFVKWQESVKTCKLTYQDKEGDWLLAGDVPWSDFIESVRRLKLIRDEQ